MTCIKAKRLTLKGQPLHIPTASCSKLQCEVHAQVYSIEVINLDWWLIKKINERKNLRENNRNFEFLNDSQGIHKQRLKYQAQT
jgi:hypothetical protein